MLEKLLLKCNDKLINLALTQFVTQKSIIQQLYNQACRPTDADQQYYSLGLRVACISNRHFDYVFDWPDFDLNALVARGLTPETTALLRNPSIPSSVLEALFRKADCFTQVDEKNWLWIIQASSKNLRLNTDKGDISGPDLDLSRLHRAIFEFLECPGNFTLGACSAGPPEELDLYHTSWADEIAVS